MRGGDPVSLAGSYPLRNGIAFATSSLDTLFAAITCGENIDVRVLSIPLRAGLPKLSLRGSP